MACDFRTGEHPSILVEMESEARAMQMDALVLIRAIKEPYRGCEGVREDVIAAIFARADRLREMERMLHGVA
jgi:hypothetical protein